MPNSASPFAQVQSALRKTHTRVSMAAASSEPTPAPPSRAARNRFALALVAIATALLAWISLPIAAALFAASVLAVVLFPMHVRATRALRGRSVLAAAVVTLLALVFVGGPLATVAALALRQVADEAVTVARQYDEGGVEAIFERMPRLLRPLARRGAEWLAWTSAAGKATAPDAADTRGEPPVPPAAAAAEPGDDASAPSAGSRTAAVPAPAPAADPAPPPEALQQLATNAASNAAAVAAWLTRQVLELLVDLVIVVLATFCLLAWGAGLVEWIEAMMPMPREQSARLVRELRDTTRGVVLATFVTAVAQTIVASIGYVIAGVGSLPLTASVTFLGAMIPVVGAAVVTCAVGVIQLFQDQIGWGLFLVAWGVTAVNLVENLLTPWLCAGRVHMPAAVLLFAIIGGIAVFGALGIVAGPLIVAFFRSVVEIARGYERPAHAEPGRSPAG